jgi:4-diphosphocytidyl-2-C-methyl-D-erythritol kinase
MIRLAAYAKLNLSLDIRGKRSDGYHELDTIMQSIDLCDEVTVERADALRVRFSAGGIDARNNTAYAAAEAFFAYTGLPGGAEISIQKNIPLMAGLGGASADAAAVLTGLNRLYGANLDGETLRMLGKRVGADVPFALLGGMARAQGIGEALTRLYPPRQFYYALLKPRAGVSTAEAFARYRASEHVSIDTVEYALLKGDMELYLKHAGNALGLSALALAPGIMAAAQALMAAGAAKALMTGSGSAMFAPFETEEEARQAAARVRGDFAYCGAHSPVPKGVIITEENG